MLLPAILLATSALTADVQSPLAPDEAVKQFQLADASLKIELAASEPNVIDPVAIRFDEDGRMWVVQMSDYPLGNPTGGEPLSKIRVLEDKDGDGLFETATTFADKLLFITGLQPWKGGVFVTRSGKLTYMKDTDGDGRADLDELWFEGFAEQNSQLRANHPRLALDNWIYVANGLRGGVVFNRKLGEEKPINISGMDFRFHPLTGACEAVSGNGQFGLAFDDWGNRFICSNRNPVKHVVIEDRYLKANPSVTVPATVNDVAAFGEKSRIFPISRAWTTSNLHAGQFTAACGVYIYRGGLLPAEFKGNAFTCDPTGNLIHREIMEPAGPTFTSKPAYEGKEFLASPDEWFRPVNMELGPDGALYVVDMYRCVIEHPDFVPEELKKRPDLRLGDNRGRIWRIVPANTNPTRQRGSANTSPQRKQGQDAPPLSRFSSEELVSLLEHPNAWQRETAQRLLIERQDQSIVPAINELMSRANALSQGRVHAAWALAGLGVQKLVPTGSPFGSNENSQLKRHNLLISENSNIDFPMAVRAALTAQDHLQLFQLLLKLSGKGKEILAKPSADWRILYSVIKTTDDRWMRSAALLFFGPEYAPELTAWLLKAGTNDGNVQFLENIAELSQLTSHPAARRSAVLAASLALQDKPEMGITALAGMSRRWSRGATAPVDVNSNSLLPGERLLELVQSDLQDWNIRSRALALLAFVPSAGPQLVSLSGPANEQRIRLAAIAALSRHTRTDPWKKLLDGFSSDTPVIRRAIIEGLLANSDRTNLLLDAIESAQIKPSEIDLAQVKRLTTYRDASIKQRAEKLLAAATPADRAKALDDYQPVLAMKGDPQHGQAVFEKNCAACHRIAGIGTTVAPDISDSRTKKYDQLLADIVQPNRAIDNNYLGYTVRLADGSVLTGILTAETATSITLRQQGGKDAVLPRTEIEELKSTGQSLMPEGLERNIPPQQMADLLAFIKNWRYLDGRTPVAQ